MRIALVGLAVVAACGDSAETPVVAEVPAGSFASLQASVLTKSCAIGGCHTAASAASAGNLSLEGEAAWANLVNTLPTLLSAKQEGLRRVRPFRPDSSLLYLKLISPPPQSGKDYGNTMPAGAAPLSAGQLEFILQWIAAGAPKAGDVANASLLADPTPQASALFQPLPPPAPGAGYQLRVDPFVVKPVFERELFVYRKLGNAADIFVNRIAYRMRPRSHHFVMYAFDTAAPPPYFPPVDFVRDIRNADGTMDLLSMLPMAFHVFVGGSMQTEFGYDFPPGVALRLPAAAALDLNVHYANRTTSPVTGEAYVNLYTVDPASVQKVAKTLNMSNTSFSLPAGQRTTIGRSFTVTKLTTVFALTSHMHSMGERFQIAIVGGARDGEVVYESTDWEHPQLLMLNTPIVLQPGQGLKSIITWNNTTANAVQFGLLSTNEMGIIFGYYY
jgi:hypothetical protein